MIETERLHLVPLTAAQMRLWTEDIPALEACMDCRYEAEPIEGVFLDIIRGQAEKTAADTANWLYHTFWFLVRKADRVVVGSADFKNVPNDRGEVEIGYGLGEAFEHSGYMTECVKAMCRWGLRQPGVSHIIAETEPNNPASEAVLRRCGFELYRQTETKWWRLAQ